MELKQLRYFVALGEHLHFARAAESLGLSTPALSLALQALEKELKVKLVARTQRRVALTEAGTTFLTDARAILAQADAARSTARRAGRGEVGTLELGYVMSAASSGAMQQLLRTFHASHPDVRLALREIESPEQIRLLSEGRLDACVVRTVTGEPAAFETRKLLREPVIVALPERHPLAKAKALQAKDLAGEPFIVPSFQQDLGFARHVLTIAHRAGFVPAIAVQTRDFPSALILVGAGYGVAIVPESMRLLQLPGVNYRRLQGEPEFVELSIVFRRNDTSPTVARLREAVGSVFRPA